MPRTHWKHLVPEREGFAVLGRPELAGHYEQWGHMGTWQLGWDRRLQPAFLSHQESTLGAGLSHTIQTTRNNCH